MWYEDSPYFLLFSLNAFVSEETCTQVTRRVFAFWCGERHRYRKVIHKERRQKYILYTTRNELYVHQYHEFHN